MEVKIVKSKLHRDFTVIPNEIIRRKDLSLDAKGLFLYIQHLPDNWIVYKSKLQEELSTGRRIVDRAFNELEAAGYLVSVDVIRKGLPQKEYVFYQYPYNEYPTTVQNEHTDVHFGKADVQNVQSTDVQNVHLLNTNNTVNTKDNKYIAQNKFERAKELSARFEKFWQLMPRKVGKEKARKEFLKLSDSELKELRDNISKHISAWEKKKKLGDAEFIMHPSTFLHQKRWRDEVADETKKKVAPEFEMPKGTVGYIPQSIV
jgi:hypothetical protein